VRFVAVLTGIANTLGQEGLAGSIEFLKLTYFKTESNRIS
jgi:hypothetical protein